MRLPLSKTDFTSTRSQCRTQSTNSSNKGHRWPCGMHLLLISVGRRLSVKKRSASDREIRWLCRRLSCADNVPRLNRCSCTELYYDDRTSDADDRWLVLQPHKVDESSPTRNLTVCVELVSQETPLQHDSAVPCLLYWRCWRRQKPSHQHSRTDGKPWTTPAWW